MAWLPSRERKEDGELREVHFQKTLSKIACLEKSSMFQHEERGDYRYWKGCGDTKQVNIRGELKQASASRKPPY